MKVLENPIMTDMKKIASDPEIITFGCRLNTYESEVMRNHAKAQGLEGAIIVNTCAVTAEAERQARQAIRKAKRENPDAYLIVTGCSAQINPSHYATMPEVDRVLGNAEKMQAESFAPSLDQKIHVTDIMNLKETAAHMISGFENRARAFIEIQNGCNHRCTFCTIPFGRGNNRSIPMGEIVQQIKMLVDQGCQEIVFTGVDITDYGQDLPAKPSLGAMTKRVLNLIPELKRLRLSSLDPSEVDETLLSLMMHEPRIMPHFHISAQAGDDMILKRMKRRHLRSDVIHFCHKIRSNRPDVVFGADLIAGFPTETEEMFQNSLSLVKECDITYLHIFPYSVRAGTPAARMPQVNPLIIKERARQLRSLGREQLKSFLKSRVGMKESLLIESPRRGRTDHFAPVSLLNTSQESGGLEIGSIVEAQITGCTDDALTAELNTQSG